MHCGESVDELSVNMRMAGETYLDFDRTTHLQIDQQTHAVRSDALLVFQRRVAIDLQVQTYELGLVIQND